MRRLARRVRDLLGKRALTFHQLLEGAVLPDCRTLLDVGCGDDSPIQVFSNKLDLSVGVDRHLPSIERSRAKGIHSRYEQLDLLSIGRVFPPASFDVVVALDVVEHFEKPDGLTLLAAMERIAQKKVIVFTPNGFLPQGEFDTNPWQVHRSGWSVDDFRDRGYSVSGVNGLRALRGAFARQRIRPAAVGDLISRLTQLVVYSAPRSAFHLLAVCDVHRG